MQLARQLHWLKVAALFGILLSAFLVYQQYAQQSVQPCIIGDYFVCTLIDTPYAYVDGLFHFLAVDLDLGTPLVSFPFPNALLFFLAFLFFAVVQLQHQQPVFGMTPRKALATLKILFYIFAAYSIYLTYVETYILYTFCLFCFILTLLIFGSLWFLISLHLSSAQQRTSSRSKRR